MKIKKSQAVAFFLALGFGKATQWGEDKLKENLTKVPKKVTEAEVPKGFEDFYAGLVQSEGKVTLLEEPASPQEEAAAEPKKSKKSKKERKAEKAEKKAAKSNGKPKKKIPELPRDHYGCREGTISFLVNAVMDKVPKGQWMTDREVAEKAGVSLDQARGRLYYAAEEGLLEHERAVRYRLKTK